MPQFPYNDFKKETPNLQLNRNEYVKFYLPLFKAKILQMVCIYSFEITGEKVEI